MLLSRSAARHTWLMAALLLLIVPAEAAETSSFAYDVLGRLAEISTTGGVNNGLLQQYDLDPVNNRVEYTVTGSQNRGHPDAPVVVLPLNGYTVMPVEVPQ